MAINEHNFGFRIVASSSVSYHTYATWGLIMENGDPIGEPEREKLYWDVPGKQDLLDGSDALTGEPVFKGRILTMSMAFTCDPVEWSTKVSVIRNAIEGRSVEIIFDDDPSHFWKGRISIIDSGRAKRLGRFTMEAYVDAHKWNIVDSQHPLEWDKMNFLTDRLDNYLGIVQITDSGTVTVPSGNLAVVPTIRVTNMTSGSFTMTVGGTTYNLANNVTYRYPQIKVNGASATTFTFTGTAKVTITYRGGSL